MAKCVEELLVYQKALAAADAVSAILRRPEFLDDRRLRDQLASSSGRVAADIAEGFAQSTDRRFAQFIDDGRGSSAETRTHLRIAVGRGYITPEERDRLCAAFDEIERMLVGLGKHLRREDRRNRGYGLPNRHR